VGSCYLALGESVELLLEPCVLKALGRTHEEESITVDVGVVQVCMGTPWSL